MLMVIIALLFTFVLFAFAWRANARFQNEDRLPMQWWITGHVTWSAPRVIALGLIPALAVFVFVSLIVLVLNVGPRPGQEAMPLTTLIGIGIMFVAIQLLHLWLIEKTLRRSGN